MNTIKQQVKAIDDTRKLLELLVNPETANYLPQQIQEKVVSIMKHYPKPGTITEELLQLNQNKGFGEK
jgi:hypothetical protein